jgi:hypothetical protein
VTAAPRGNLAGRAVRRVRRLARRIVGPAEPAAAADPFAPYRALHGPTLVSGPAPRHAPHLDGDPRLVVLLPHLDVGKMSGGPNTAFHVTARLVDHGVRLRYVATSGPLSPDGGAVRDHLRRVTGRDVAAEVVDFIDASAKGGTFDVGGDDVLLATWWPTAHLANAALAHVRAPAFLYLVQDYETAFYPASSKAALAEATYGMPMRPIVNHPFLEAFLRERRIGRFGDTDLAVATFMPSVDRAVFAPRHDAASSGSRRLVFYARPRNPRNLFEIGLRALREAVRRGVFDDDDWSFVAVGQELPSLPLSARHVLVGSPWLSYGAYGELLGTSDILLSLMLSPHPSYPPLEMAAAGGLVVTNAYGPKTAEALAAISSSIRAAEPDVESLVGALAAAVAEVRGRGDRPWAAEVSLPATWDDAVRDVVPWLADQVRDLRAGG